MSYLTFPTPRAEDYPKFSSETAKYRHLTAPHCAGVTVDLASQGDPVVPWAISFDLPEAEYLRYSGGRQPPNPIPLRGHADQLPFVEGSIDTLYSSHLLEDYFDWTPILREWVRVVRPGGKLVILVPDKKLWNEAIARGQPPNCQHRHESHPGELTTYAAALGLEVLEDRLTACYPGDYTILFVARKRA